MLVLFFWVVVEVFGVYGDDFSDCYDYFDNLISGVLVIGEVVELLLLLDEGMVFY